MANSLMRLYVGAGRRVRDDGSLVAETKYNDYADVRLVILNSKVWKGSLDPRTKVNVS